MARPVIGVTESREEPAALYAEAVEDAGGGAVVIDLAAARAPEDVLAEVNGLLLTGGGDVDPALYGQERHPETRVKRGRDETELALIRAAMERDMPVFGICRGMQAINVALGGSLDQHVLDHRSPGAPGLEPVYHEVFVPPGSRITNIVGVGGFMKVNSLHHQAVTHKGKAPGLLVSAYSVGDGIIEALDSPRSSHRWVVGVQWHPERREEVPRHHRKLFTGFVEAARELGVSPRP